MSCLSYEIGLPQEEPNVFLVVLCVVHYNAKIRRELDLAKDLAYALFMQCAPAVVREAPSDEVQEAL